MKYVKLDIQRFASDMTITCTETGTNTSNNTSSITLTVTIKRRSGSSDYWIKPNYRALTVTTSDGQSQSVSTEYPSNKSQVSFNFDFTIRHNDDGTGSVDYTANLARLSSSLPALSASGSATLTTIPRYFTSSPTLTLVSKTETTATFRWTTPENCDQAQYKINSGSWVNVSGTGTSGTYTISGLTPGQSYTIYGDYKRADSQLWSTWGGYVVSCPLTMHDYPKPTNTPDFTIGNTLNINVSNPLSRQISLELISNVDNSVIGTYTGTGNGSIPITLDNDLMYQTIPNAPSGTYYASVVCSTTSSTKTYGNGTYTINANDCKPLMSVVTYQDANATTLALTGNNQTLIDGYSTIQVTIGTNNKATARKYATITGYKIENGLNSSVIVPEVEGEDIVLTITATSSIIKVWAIDSREQSGSYEIANANLISYTPIQKNQNPVAQRCDSQGIPNGVGEYVKITLDGTYWNNSFGSVTNSIQSISYNYANTQTPSQTTPGTTTITATTSNNNYEVDQLILGDTAQGFDVSNSYIINVTVSDELSSTTFTMTLGSGTPHICYDDDGIGIMKKFDTSNSSSLQVDGEIDCTGYNLNGTPLAFPVVHDSYDTSTTETYSCNYVNSQLKNIVRDIFYPVGKIYLTVGNEDPNQTIGGTWVKVSGGHLYACVNSISNSSFTGTGTQSHVLTENEMPSHRHSNGSRRIDVAKGTSDYWEVPYSSQNLSYTFYSQYTGGNQGHSHDVSYIGVWAWKRTA